MCDIFVYFSESCKSWTNYHKTNNSFSGKNFIGNGVNYLSYLISAFLFYHNIVESNFPYNGFVDITKRRQIFCECTSNMK